MKSVNGNNKLERQINKALKYSGVELVEGSNSKLIVKKESLTDSHFVFYGNAAKLINGKFGLCYMVKPDNAEKASFYPDYKAIQLSPHYHGKALLIQVCSADKEKLMPLISGADDVVLANSIDEIKIDKN